MIECYDKNIWYIKKKRVKKNRKIRFFLIIAICVVAVILYSNLIIKNISEICYDKIKGISTESVNLAIIENAKNNFIYDDLINIEKNGQGEISYIETNAKNVSIISGELTNGTKKILSEKLSNGVKIPAFAFSGIKIFSGYGREINYNSFKVISVESTLQNQFESVGINQTKHSVFLVMDSNVKVYTYLGNKEINIKTPVLLCETVIVGKIPSVYLNK